MSPLTQELLPLLLKSKNGALLTELLLQHPPFDRVALVMQTPPAHPASVFLASTLPTSLMIAPPLTTARSKTTTPTPVGPSVSTGQQVPLPKLTVFSSMRQRMALLLHGQPAPEMRSQGVKSTLSLQLSHNLPSLLPLTLLKTALPHGALMETKMLQQMVSLRSFSKTQKKTLTTKMATKSQSGLLLVM